MKVPDFNYHVYDVMSFYQKQRSINIFCHEKIIHSTS
ncbi:hypothetical protein BMS3Bbin06_01902 [bacterium BMS3Bbin06]|nr:hypothetical protein BMS3Bbin06_01902 [bacterium BMS3Bbin06]